ncbi:unnamed protein product [Heligmosomoides polygyrus]|uniref:Uncharacterized protein n=1 Tax=Heligmosomoides polygyrus TaxID=6339 RepID=A0A183FDU9_HELPZ|nr:unnamed protein product [Heligmosomoides polygyrus]
MQWWDSAPHISRTGPDSLNTYRPLTVKIPPKPLIRDSSASGLAVFPPLVGGKRLMNLAAEVLCRQVSEIATTGVMPSANGALSKLLCSCYSKKVRRGLDVNEPEPDHYEPPEKEHLVQEDQQQPKEKQQNQQQHKKQEDVTEKQPVSVVVEVTTPIEEFAADEVFYSFFHTV